MSSLYLHIPFCRSKCPYCDFYSSVGTPQQLAEYVELLQLQLPFLNTPEDPLATIFLGGGTPSLLTAEQLDQLLQAIAKQLGIAEDAEITLEANPGTLDADKLRGYRTAGVNRLSLGVQSLSDCRLQQLGRSHSVADAQRSVLQIRAAGFDNLSLDLMFAQPGQTDEELAAELAGLLALAPEHLSIYGLSVEPETPYAEDQRQGTLVLPDEQDYARQYQLLHQQLSSAGFEHYEISNFARPGRRCRHNQVYWQRRSCLAAGCGAHGFRNIGWGERWHVPADLERYRQQLRAGANPAEQLEQFDKRGAMSETLYLGLRTSDGVCRRTFAERFGLLPEEQYPQAFQQLKPRLKLENDSWRFDLDGWLIYDHLISSIL